MNILVSAASKHGATAEISAVLVSELRHQGVSAEFRDPRDVVSLDRFDGVVLGSAVYAGHWMSEARVLAWNHATELRKRSVWLFSSGPVGSPPRPEEDVDVHDVLEITGARDHRVFAGNLDRHVLGFGERAIVRAVRAQEGDFRDWDAIAAWATEIARALSDVALRKPMPEAAGTAS